MSDLLNIVCQTLDEKQAENDAMKILDGNFTLEDMLC